MNKKPVGSKRMSHEYVLIKIADPNVWQQEHRWAWEQVNGPIPDGYVVHHKDFNKQNNSLDNLVMMTEKEHKILHGKEAIKVCHTSEVRKKHSEFMKKYMAKKYKDHIKNTYIKKHPDGYKVSEETKEKIRNKLKSKPWTEARRNAQK